MKNIVYWKSHVAAYTGAQVFLVPGMLPRARYSVTSEAPPVTLMPQLRQTSRRIVSRVFGRVN